MKRRRLRELLDRYRVSRPETFRLEKVDPGDTAGLSNDAREAKARLEKGIVRLGELQARLYAQDRWAVLVILQGIDAAGKDGTIKHVMSGINPQGVQVHSFKQPSPEELDHDFLRRASERLPARGNIGIFNRSYYEEVLVVRVHRELLTAEKLPDRLVTNRLWKERYEDIDAFERYLSNQGYRILKFFLHLSKKEQKRRLLARLDDPEKNWKFSADDVRERGFWKDYQSAHEEMIRSTSTPSAPWYVIPADHKWFTRLAVAEILIDTLRGLDLAYPKVGPERRKELAAIRRGLV
jgi:PPK2 family polyphosphate:nucleotide phosphotransferase